MSIDERQLHKHPTSGQLLLRARAGMTTHVVSILPTTLDGGGEQHTDANDGQNLYLTRLVLL